MGTFRMVERDYFEWLGAKVTKRNTFARLSLLFILKLLVIHKYFCTFAAEYSNT